MKATKRKTTFFILTAALLLAAGSAHAIYYQSTSQLKNTPLEKKALIRENFAGSKCLGEQFDPNTNFYYLRARWYSPTVGRFTSVDPFAGNLQSPMSLHRYLYANASPVYYVDPKGEFSLSAAITSAAITLAISSIVIPNFQGFLWDVGSRTDNFSLQFVLGGYGGWILAGGILGAWIWERPSSDGTYFGRRRAFFNVWMLGLGGGGTINIASTEIPFHIVHDQKRKLENFKGVGRITTIGYDAGIGGFSAMSMQLPEGTYINPVPGFSLTGGKGVAGIIALVVWQMRSFETLWE